MKDISEIDRDALVDLRTVQINTNLPKAERMLDYVRQIKDPCCYRIGKYVVCLRFSEDSPTVQEVFYELVRSKTGG